MRAAVYSTRASLADGHASGAVVGVPVAVEEAQPGSTEVVLNWVRGEPMAAAREETGAPPVLALRVGVCVRLVKKRRVE